MLYYGVSDEEKSSVRRFADDDLWQRQEKRNASMYSRLYRNGGSMKNDHLDAIDKQILEILQRDARTPVKDIAQEVFLTAPAVSARINNLVKEKYITGFHASLNPELLGYHIKAFINLEVEPKDKKEFYPFIKECPNVIECNCVTGDYSMLLEVQFKSTIELDQFIGELQIYGRTKTLIVFSTFVDHREVSVQ